MSQLDGNELMHAAQTSKDAAATATEAKQGPIVQVPEPGLQKDSGPEGATGKALMLAAEAKREQEARAEAERLAAAALGNVPVEGGPATQVMY